MSTMSAAQHPWLLLAPWYRWELPGVPASGRPSAPILQMYPAPSFVNDFLAEPQRSLKFTEEDTIRRVRRTPGILRSGPARAAEATNLRKVFLDTHSRFYLVVCELHCDAPGLPSVAREQVCEAGFVVRRRVPQGPPEALKALAIAFGERAEVRAEIGAMETSGVRSGVLREARERRRSRLKAELDERSERVQGVIAEKAVRLVLQGWVPSGVEGVGAWTEVSDELPRIATTEAILPLYPLIPDPAARRHSARGRTLYFGVLPTGSSDLDERGEPRFDDRSCYEARAFVRRHKPGCPRRSTRNDCPGELVWSRPTERYQLASHGDLVGTSHRPVTIQLPNLDDLEAQANRLPFGKGVGMRMVSPAGSSLEFGVDGDNQPTNARRGGASICMFAIPLITIVATFVLQLFLPIVVFLFQLWFLLRLKFCILPSFSVSADLAVDLDAELRLGADLNLDASLKAEIDLALDANIHPGVSASLHDPSNPSPDYNDLGKLVLDASTDFSADVPPDLAAGFEPPDEPSPEAIRKPLPTFEAGLEYYERVEVLAP